MSGHSKWNNIQGRKNAQDAKRGKLFQKLSHEIYTAAKTGGGELGMNPGLRVAVEKAKAANMPNDNIERAIKKATSGIAGAHFEEISYEGYGPGGVAILVEAVTDNRNRTQTNVRVAFTRNGGTLGETGSVNYLFERQGLLLVNRETVGISEDALFAQVIEAGAEDLRIKPDVFEIYTKAEDFGTVRDTLAKLLPLAEATLTMVPQTTVQLTTEQQLKLEQLLDKLAEDDDVAEVYTNVEKL